jgi:hypothetical protein
MGNDVQERIAELKTKAIPNPPPLKTTGSNSNSNKVTDSKSVINSFFDNKKDEVQQSKLGFKSII